MEDIFDEDSITHVATDVEPKACEVVAPQRHDVDERLLSS
jgi:hypothetical protein